MAQSAPSSSSDDAGAPERREEFTVNAEEAGVRLDVVVSERIAETSRAQARRWIDDGRVAVDGRKAKPSRLCREGERIEIALAAPVAAEPVPESISLDVRYEDRDLIVVNKPAGMVVHPAPGHPTGTLVNALLAHCNDLSGIAGVERPGIVHRLDAGTSGLIVVAKHDRSHRGLAEQFANRSVDKRYVALVHGTCPDRLSLKTPIGRDGRQRTKISSRSPRPKAAETEVHLRERLPLCSLVDVRIFTGRTHQIRVHLSEASFPVVGDRDYGAPRFDSRLRSRDRDVQRALGSFARPALHAAELGLRHPMTGETMRWVATLAKDIQALLVELRRHRDEEKPCAS